MGKGDLFNFAAGGSYLEPQAMEGMEDEFAFEVHCGFSHSCVLVSFDSSKKEAFNPRWEIDPPPQELLTTPSILRQPEEAPKTRKPRITDFNAWNKWKPSEVDSDEEREKEIERLKKKSERNMKKFISNVSEIRRCPSKKQKRKDGSSVGISIHRRFFRRR